MYDGGLPSGHFIDDADPTAVVAGISLILWPSKSMVATVPYVTVSSTTEGSGSTDVWWNHSPGRDARSFGMMCESHDGHVDSSLDRGYVDGGAKNRIHGEDSFL